MIKHLVKASAEAESEQEQQEAIEAWRKARLLYSEESSVFQRIRRSMPKRSACSPEQLAVLEIARMRYSTASRVFEEARSEFQALMQPARKKIQEVLAQAQQYIKELDASSVESIDSIKERQKQRMQYGSLDAPGNAAIIAELQKSMGIQSDGLGVEDESIEASEQASENIAS